MAKTHSGAEVGVCAGRARISATELYWSWRPIRSHSQQFKLRQRAMVGDLVTRWPELHSGLRGGRAAGGVW